jgi:hypothetical protein
MGYYEMNEYVPSHDEVLHDMQYVEGFLKYPTLEQAQDYIKKHDSNIIDGESWEEYLEWCDNAEERVVPKKYKGTYKRGCSGYLIACYLGY